MYRLRFKSLMLVTALLACGDDPIAPDPDAATFTLRITGALTETATGPAFFGSDEDAGGDPAWVLLLGEEDGRHVVVAGKEGAGRPGTGTYTLAAAPGAGGEWTLAHIVGDGDELLGMFLAESGSVTLTESSDQEIRGTLSFRAVDALTSDTLRVTGSFVAVPAPSASSPLRVGRP